MTKIPSAGSKDTVLMAISTGPSFNYTSHKKDAVAGYTLYSFIDNAEATAEHTFFNGQPAYLLDQTTQPKCFGDAAGRGGGVRSGTVGGEVKPTSGSSTIFIEGKALIREGDTCTMNNGNVKGKYVTVDAAQAEQIMAQWADKSTEQALADGGLLADSEGGLLSGIGPSNQDISDFTGISRDKIDAAGNTAAGFNQMWTFGVSDVLFGAPDPNKVSTKAGQVAGMAVLSSTGASSASQASKSVQAITKTATRGSVRTFHKVTGHKHVSTGRTQASNVTERMAMNEIKSNPQGKTLRGIKMSDTKNGLHTKDGWVKRSQVVKTSKGKVEVHYAHNTNTGKNVDFKYKNPPLKD
ncbi:PAAR-like domain-containing protein [Psychrobacter sp. HII-4]|uniref:PAAR-like domain-containing protein n=1 Tax=Psychrobacter sp. HII-4 TaxID=1569264 RepID=UPI001919CDA6|nr:PAAR-like domain-containing protein [Psychrobacter sp. HII-4]